MKIYAIADYITIHIPATPETKGFINADVIAKMKDGVRIVNLSRGDIVNTADIIAALESGKVASYVTDFPCDELIGVKGAVLIPHLGASTPESEDNCAVIAADELMDFIENGNIRFSVNYPSIAQPRNAKNRLLALSREHSRNARTDFNGTRRRQHQYRIDDKSFQRKLCCFNF